TGQEAETRDQRPFIVSSGFRNRLTSAEDISLNAQMISQDQSAPAEELAPLVNAATAPEKQISAGLASSIALVDAELVLQYRVKTDGLADYLKFASDDIERRQRLTDRERAIQAISLEEVSKHFYSMPIEDVLGSRRGRISSDLAMAIQKTLDGHHAGVE